MSASQPSSVPAAASEWHPRSGHDMVDGYVWLPRMLSKARRGRTDALGDYLSLENSMMDSFFLRGLGLTGAQVRGWLDEGLADEAIVARIAEVAGHPDLAARERWSRGFSRKFGLAFTAIDADEDRLPPGPLASLLRAALNAAFTLVKLTSRPKAET